MKTICMAGLALALAATTPAAADVFGVKMGANPVALGGELQPENAGRPVRPYLLETLPKPHPEFELLMLTSSAKTGVCKVSALGRYHENDVDGASILAAQQVQRAEMDRQYGPSRAYVEDGKPVVAWNFISGANLPADIRAITLLTESTSSNQTYLVARYELANFDACEAQM